MHVPDQEVRLLTDHALPFDDIVAADGIVNEPATRSELRCLPPDVLDANTIAELELAEHRARFVAQEGGADRDTDALRFPIKEFLDHASQTEVLRVCVRLDRQERKVPPAQRSARFPLQSD